MFTLQKTAHPNVIITPNSDADETSIMTLIMT